ncbi:MAG TPA: hypothetical protein RMI62_07075, partial [Polyangiaceae bacterium LLY-WYZ-15_(1-7)]|nr:hypothetical protein [Polyangiaceae bacterium LLY-WYZ-15_(1-7)]
MRPSLRLAAFLLLACGPATTPRPAAPPAPEPEAPPPPAELPAEPLPLAAREGGEAPGAPVLATIRGALWDVAWTPGGEALAVVTSEKTVAILDAETGA